VCPHLYGQAEYARELTAGRAIGWSTSLCETKGLRMRSIRRDQRVDPMPRESIVIKWIGPRSSGAAGRFRADGYQRAFDPDAAAHIYLVSRKDDAAALSPMARHTPQIYHR
jgi:hypothetical protein